MNFIDFWSLSMYAGRQCRAERKMLYGNMVKNFIQAGDANIVSWTQGYIWAHDGCLDHSASIAGG
jgi:hypothetical protein